GRPLVGKRLLRVLLLVGGVVRDGYGAQRRLEPPELAVLERALVGRNDDQVDDRQHPGHDDEQPDREPPADAPERAHSRSSAGGAGTSAPREPPSSLRLIDPGSGSRRRER